MTPKEERAALQNHSMQPIAAESETAKVERKYSARFKRFFPNYPHPGPGRILTDPKEQAEHDELLSEYNRDMRKAGEADAREHHRRSRAIINQMVKDGICTQDQVMGALRVVGSALQETMKPAVSKEPSAATPKTVSVTADANGGANDDELVSRSETARRLNILACSVTRFAAKHQNVAENSSRGSRIYFEPFRREWEQQQSIRRRDSETRTRAEQRANQDARRAENRLADAQPRNATRQG